MLQNLLASEAGDLAANERGDTLETLKKSLFLEFVAAEFSVIRVAWGELWGHGRSCDET